MVVESPTRSTKPASQAELHHAASWIEKGVLQSLQSKSLWKEASQYFLSKEYPDLVKRKIIPLPSALIQQYAYVESKCFMGIFPEIERAWFTVDNKLFLWNYNQESDFIAHDVSDQVIVSVCLAKPVPGVFTERFRYVLVVANTVEILLFGVSVSTLATNSYNILLVPTKFRVSTDFVSILKICSTPEGRVFLSGSDGCLYEFVYGRFSGSSLSWIRKPNYCHKINHSFSFSQYFIPDIFKRWMDEDPLIDICFDELHSCLFTLSERGTLTLYHVSSGSRLTRSCRVSVIDDIGHFGGTEAKSRSRSFLQIYSCCEREYSVVSSAVGTPIDLVVFTCLGERIYYSVVQSVLGSYNLKAQKYRHFPAMDTSFPLIHVTLWSKGFVLMADARDVMHDSIIAIQSCKLSPMSNSQMAHPDVGESITPVSLHELVSGVDRNSHDQTSLSQVKAWDFAEKKFYSSADQSMTLSWEEERSIYLCLTNTALLELERQRPFDHLCHILDTEPNNLNSFINRYGVDELCTLCVSIVSTSLQEESQLFGKTSPKVVEEAIRTYFGFGGTPQWLEHTSPLRTVANGSLKRRFDVGRPAKSVSNAIKFSSAHNGVVTKLSRDVCKIWNSHFVKKEDSFITLCWNPQQMKAVRIRVQATAQFIQKYIIPGVDSSFSWLSFGERELSESRSIQDRLYRDLFQRKKMEEAKKAEYHSLLSLYHLACRVAEALSLLSILYENQFHRLVASLNEPYHDSLQRITFGDFCVSEAGKRLASSLLTALFQYYGEEEGLVESLTELLSSQCPSFFGKEERCLQSGMDLLSRARSLVSEDRHQVYQLTERAIEEFRKVIPVIEDYKAICTKIESLGAISLLFGFLLEAIVTIRFQQQNDKLEECYEILFSLIERYLLMDTSSEGHEEPWKDAVVQRLRQLKDESFHKRLCLYLLTMGDRGTSLLIRLSSPFVESYLMEQQRYDVLWKYYGHEGRYKEAAAVLVKLAKESPSLGLDERISWLGQALQLANLQLSKSGGASVDERILVKEIQDCLDVAKIQVRCKEELARRHPNCEESTLSYIQSIDSKLMDLNTIYNHIARPLELWETELDILRCAEYEDMELVQHLWIDLIDDCLFPDKEFSVPDAESWKRLERLFIRLGKDFSSSMNVFPMYFLVSVLEQRHLEYIQMKDGGTKVDIAIYRWLESIGHSKDMILSIYCKCLEEGLGFVAPSRMRGTLETITSWSHDIAQYHLIQVIKQMIEDSIPSDTRIASSTQVFGRTGFREENLQRAISLCCNRLRVVHMETSDSLFNTFCSWRRL